MDKNASLDARSQPDHVADKAWEEAMARARLKRLRARPVRRPPKPIGRDIRRLTRKHLKGTGTPLSKLQDNWDSIVGDKLAKLCRPEKLSGAKAGRTLTLRVLPAAASLVQHQSETIRQRVSVQAGGNITKLKLLQGPLRTGEMSYRKPKRALSAEERLDLEKSAAKIESPALKAAIVALGRAVLTDES